MDGGTRPPSEPRRDVAVAIPAAGSGRRMGGRRKQYLELAGEPVLLRAVRPFLARDDVAEVVVALPAEDASAPPAWLTGADDRIRTVAGGASRGASVRAALEDLSAAVRIVVIHDGARPLLDPGTLRRCVEEARAGRGAVAGVPAVDTMKEVEEGGRIVRTPDRSRLWHAQTPQAFPREVVVEAYRGATDDELAATDDASLVERLGREVRMVRGSRRNLKVTRPGDLAVAEALLRRADETPSVRGEASPP